MPPKRPIGVKVPPAVSIELLVKLVRRIPEEPHDQRRENRDKDEKDQETPPARATRSFLSRIQAI